MHAPMVHEYGGGAYTVHSNNGHGDTVYFVNFVDQRLYRQVAGDQPVPISPQPAQERGLRYADLRLTADGRWLVCVRERHEEQGVTNEIVLMASDGSSEAHVLASGYDFYSNPRLSPDGRQLAWLCWNHPLMPWDGCELWLAELDATQQLHNPRRVAGGNHESLFQPEWSPAGQLHFVSDRTNWWNLYRLRENEVEPVAPIEAEIGGPQWVFDLSSYAFLPNGEIVCTYSQNGFNRLGIIRVGESADHPIRK